MKKLMFVALLLTANVCEAQKSMQPVKPKLVVGIVVDQMKYDYVFRYWDKLGNGGFKRLMNEGMFCKDVHYNYVPTYTAPGHAAIYTGTTPAINGIISNDWYNRENDSNMYCVADKKVTTLGASNTSGQMSPFNLLTTTVGDELKISTNYKSKVIGVALKDRGAILPAGRSADAAYWWDALTSNWISSTWYFTALPKWADDFNAKKLPSTYLAKGWNTLLPIDKYTESTIDNSPYEGVLLGETLPVFPHNLMAAKNAEVLKYTPWGNTLTLDFAIAAMEGEKLGKGETTDMLTVSFSSTDYVGHKFGTHAIETEDTYLQLDKNIEVLLKYLDENFGKQNVLVFLTADHAAIPNPQFLADHKLNSGFFKTQPIVDSLKKTLVKYYNDSSLFLAFDNDQIYLNRKLAQEKKINLKQLQNEIADFCGGFPGVYNALSASRFNETEFNTGINHLVQMGINKKRSGDVILQLEPGLIEWFGTKGTTHGSAYTYDTHVPLWFYGGLITPGTTSAPLNITDIAPTLSNLLNIEFPNGCTGKPIQAICK